MPERLRMSFEQLGPTFIKLGQLLASRPDLIPKEFSEEFKKLHNQVSTVEFSQVEGVLKSHFGKELNEVFQSFSEEPLAAASIAQVYRAVLLDGTPVVVKVQRPGIETIIEEDLGVLVSLAGLLVTYVPESRVYNPEGIVYEFAKALELETNFLVEANNITRFQKNFADEKSIIIPKVYKKLSGRRILVMEELQGIPLSHKNALEQEGIDPESVLKVGLRAYLKMVFKYGLFHGDLHAGNLFVLPNNRIGLIDFGIVGRLNKRVQDSIANMLIALASEDYDRMAYEYIDLTPYNEDVDVDKLSSDLRDLIAPYYGLNLESMNIGRLLMDSAALVAKHKLVLPSELIIYFKSIISIEGMGRIIMKDFDFLSYSLEFASELVQSRYEPQRVAKNLSLVARDVNALLVTMPRQLKQILRKINSPNFSMDVSIKEIHFLRKSMERSANLLFLGLVIGSLLLSSAMMANIRHGENVLGLPLMSVIGYTVALVLSLAAFINYIKK